MRRPLLAIIKYYQANISPDHSPRRRLFPYGFCKFYPSCSEYAKNAITKKGVNSGIWLSIKRLLRCHPWSTGGFDPVPHI